MRIKEHLENAVTACLDLRMKAAAPALLESLNEPANEGTALFEAVTGENNYGGEPILHHLDPVVFADVMLTDGRINRPIIAALVLRYQYWGAESALLIERPWLQRLKDELDRRATALGPPFEKALTAAWAQKFGEIFGVLNLMETRREAANVQGA